MDNLSKIQSLTSDSISLIEILKEACQNNLENSFASDTLVALEVIAEKQTNILDLIDKIN